MELVILNIACPFAPLGPEAPGRAEQLLTQIDTALVHAGHESIVMACEGSVTEGILLAIPRPSEKPDDAERARLYGQYRFTLEKFLEKWPIDVIHMHGPDFYEYLPPTGLPVVVTLHSPVREYPEKAFRQGRPQTFLHYAPAPVAPELKRAGEPALVGVAHGEEFFGGDLEWSPVSEDGGPSVVSIAAKYLEIYRKIVEETRAIHQPVEISALVE